MMAAEKKWYDTGWGKAVLAFLGSFVFLTFIGAVNLTIQVAVLESTVTTLSKKIDNLTTSQTTFRVEANAEDEITVRIDERLKNGKENHDKLEGRFVKHVDTKGAHR